MSKEHLLRGHIITATLDIEDGVIAVSDRHITYCGPAPEFNGAAKLPEPHGTVLMPGLVDLHCHGALGADFSEGSVEGASSAARYLHSRGTTTLLASVVTGSPEHLVRNIRSLRTVMEEGIIAGIHLEGPFLSMDQCGAHAPELLLEPNAALMAELLHEAGPALTTITVAAELPGASEIVDLVSNHGVIPSLGHTAANDATAAAFLQQAAVGLAAPTNKTGRSRPTVTHLFNAMPPLHHRSPGPVSASLGAARAGSAVVELIADGVHLAPAAVKLVFELVGAENIALVTDSMAATGLEDGKYRLGPLAVTVDDRVARVDATGAIAGGTATLLDVVQATTRAGVSLREAVSAATAVPASVLGLSATVGDLHVGMSADIVMINQDLQLIGTLRQGKWTQE